MEFRDLDRNQKKALFASALLITVWIGLPQYLQMAYGVSAVQVSFAIIFIYYVGFRLWKHFNDSSRATF